MIRLYNRYLSIFVEVFSTGVWPQLSHIQDPELRKEGAGYIKGMVLVAVGILGVLNTVFAVFLPSPPSGFCGFSWIENFP